MTHKLLKIRLNNGLKIDEFKTHQRPMFLRVVIAYKERTLEGNHSINTNSQTLEVQPYQFSNLIEVMVVHIHPTLGYALVRPLIQVDGEGDGVFLPTSHLLYAEVVRVNIVHLLDGRVPLVEGPPVVNECRGSFLIRSWHILRRPSPHHRLSIRDKHQPIGRHLDTINHETSPSSPQWRCIDHFGK